MTAPIVAGIDGSEESLAAVEWAGLEAARHRVPLCIVHVVDYHPRPPGPFRHDLPHRARSALARASHHAAAAAPGVDLRTAAVFGRPDRVLTAITARALLVVVGTRGTGSCSGRRTGSVALRLASRASCPVVFTAAASRPVFGEIVVGTGGGGQAAALEFGFGEADMRGVGLTALYAWAHPEAGRPDSYHDWMLSVGAHDKGAEALLSEQVAPWRHKYPDVIVTESTVHGHPGRVLALASGHADLVVVGSGLGQLAPVPGLGLVGYDMLQHGQCPVAIIPDDAAGGAR